MLNESTWDSAVSQGDEHRLAEQKEGRKRFRGLHRRFSETSFPSCLLQFPFQDSQQSITTPSPNEQAYPHRHSSPPFPPHGKCIVAIVSVEMVFDVGWITALDDSRHRARQRWLHLGRHA